MERALAVAVQPAYRTRVRTLSLFLFFLSGASALAYEVTWVRILGLAFGVSVYAVTAVLSAFMGGLALGSFLLGRLATQTAATRPQAALRLYAALQAGVAICALLSPVVFVWLTGFYVWFYNQVAPGFYFFNLIRFGLAALVLLLPAMLMGGSFPVMSQLMAADEQKRGGDLGRLYAVNTLGGVIGTIMTGLVLIRFLGTHNTIYLAAGIDLVVAASAAALSLRPNGNSELAKSAALTAGRTPTATHPPLSTARERSMIWWGFGLSGFVALGYEVAWTRLLSIFTMNTVYSFTIMLTTFLAGLALGSVLAARRVDRVREPLALFGYLQLAIGLAAILILFVFAKLPTILEALVSVVSFKREVMAEFLAGGLTMIVPTMLIGATFPAAARVFTSGSHSVGGDVGRLYAINTVAAMLGSVVAGFILIPLIGLQRTALLLAVLNLTLGAGMLLLGTASPRWQAGTVLIAAAVAAVALPPGIYLGFREGTTPLMTFYKEGADATVAVFEVPDPPLKISFVNGRSEVPTDRDSMRAFHLLGDLPPLLRPGAQSALMISFGNGIAAGTMARQPIPRIQAVEIVAEQVEAAQLYEDENRGVLHKPNVQIAIEDGRNYLLRSPERFDIITADATHPVNSSSWALFTREFYLLARQHLSNDGVMVQWLPFHDLAEQDYRNIIATFQSVFPHTTLWFTGGSHTFLVGTPRPLSKADIAGLDSRIKAMGIADDLVSGQRLAEDLLLEEDGVKKYVAGAHVVDDDHAFFLPALDMDRILASFAPYTQPAQAPQK